VQVLLIIDVKNGIVNLGDFREELAFMENVIKDFKNQDKPVIIVRNLDDEEESPFYKGSGLHS
jgi:hypothetical protein